MKAYILFLIVIILEWLLLFPGAKLTLGREIPYKQRKIFLVIVCIEMIGFAGIRDTALGADTTTYLRAFEYYSALPQGEILGAALVSPYDFEVGYFWLTKLCAWLSIGKTGFLIVIAALIYIPVCRFTLKYSESPLMGILVYFAFSFFQYSLGIFRQMIALSITLLGVKYIFEQKFGKFLLTVAIAMTFHTTAIIVLPLYWIYRLKLENKMKWIFAVEAVCLVCARPLVLFAVRLFPKYANYVSGRFDVQGGSYVMLILLNAILIAGCLVEKRKENQDNIVLRMSVNATIMAILLQIVGYSMGIFGRIVPYYSIYLVILIPTDSAAIRLSLVDIIARPLLEFTRFCTMNSVRRTRKIPIGKK